jgi:tRNA pseudouridine55 synthase
MDGLLIVDKPVGPSSHDVVARLRRTLGEPRIGHTGTLDPAASGLLAVVLGRATRLARFLAAADKRYRTTVRLGVETDTYDAEGVPSPRSTLTVPDREQIDRALDAFRGVFEQRPPVFSAKKIGGRRSYKMARAARRSAAGGAAPVAAAEAPRPATVTVHAIDIIDCAGDLVTLDISCSTGFYVRSLAHDLGAALGVGAHVVELRRTRSGRLDIAEALPLAAAEADPAGTAAAVIPLSRMLPELGAVVLTDDGVRHAVHGRPLGPDDVAEERGAAAGPVRLVRPDGDLLGIADAVAGSALLHPSVILM